MLKSLGIVLALVALQSFTARGVVRSIAADKRSITIAHEAIPGYMGAMTMSFEASTPSQLDGLAAGDHVRFAFTATDDGRRVITQIAKDASGRSEAPHFWRTIGASSGVPSTLYPWIVNVVGVTSITARLRPA